MEHLIAEIREMRGADLGFVLTWRNHPTIRMNSGSENEITKSEHVKWFDNDSIKLLFLLNKEPTGVVRFDHLTAEMPIDAYEWSFYLNPFDTLPNGTGTLMLTLAMQFIRSKAVGIIGQVKEDNQESISLHKKLGFKEVLPSMDMKFRRFYKSL